MTTICKYVCFYTNANICRLCGSQIFLEFVLPAEHASLRQVLSQAHGFISRELVCIDGMEPGVFLNFNDIQVFKELFIDVFLTGSYYLHSDYMHSAIDRAKQRYTNPSHAAPRK